jgi:hypothetical protein
LNFQGSSWPRKAKENLGRKCATAHVFGYTCNMPIQKPDFALSALEECVILIIV